SIVTVMAGERQTWMPSQIRYRPPIHFRAVSQCMEDLINAPMPNMHRAISTTNPSTPPTMVKEVLRVPCKAPWVRASNPLGPGDRESPTQVTRHSSQVSSCMAVALGGEENGRHDIGI